MKITHMLLKTFVFSGLMFLAATAFAQKSSVAMGEQMFMDSHLAGSTNANSCNSCHAGGKGMTQAKDNPMLSRAINNCLVAHMGGMKMDGRTAAMRSMKMYVMAMLTHQ